MQEPRKDFSIAKDNTLWVFISDSTEARHALDVIHAVSVLQQKGIDNSAIRYFTDDHQAIKYTSPFNCPDPIQISSLSSELGAITGYENLIVIVAGHGGMDGIGHPVKISPDYLVKVARSVPGVELVVMALTQCFAGVFNFADARSNPPIVMFGAANLGSSLSTPINFPLTSGSGDVLQGWAANSFMFYLFRWLLAPRDIDGDGRVSMLDAYKFSGSSASGEIILAKPIMFMESQRLAIELQSHKDKINKEVQDAQSEGRPVTFGITELLEQQAIETQLREKVSILHVSQEPWLLHADLARKVVVL